ncbi:MAG TPA: BatD family protein [Fibrobacteria bacterium]|nr:BatD family protein [Fibrobacteria bacterium]
MVPTGRLAARIATVLLATAAVAHSKILDAQAQLENRQVRVGERTALYVTVSTDSEGQALPWPEVQTGPGLAVVDKNRNESSSEQISIVNFKMERKRTVNVQFVFQLAAAKPGNYAVGPILFQGRNLGSAQISVVDAPQDVRIATMVDRKTIYVGQQIPFTWRLSADRPFEVLKFPDVRTALGSGFYSESPDSQQLRMKVVDENGRKVGRLDLTGSLFPLRTGGQTLPSTSLDYRIVDRSPGVDPMEAMLSGQDPFEAMMGTNRVIQGTANTQPVALQVLPVPAKGRPASFQGGVGTFHMDAKLEKTKLRAGDGTTLTMVLEGTGQPQASGVPVWQAPSGVETYPPQDDWTKVWKDGVLTTRLTRRIVLVPRHAGHLGLDSVRFAWFDPAAAKFRTSALGLGGLSVDPAPVVPGTVDTAALRALGPALSGADRFWILFGKVSAVLWTALLLAGAGFGLWRWIRHRLSREYAQRRALQVLEKRLSLLPETLPAQRQAGELRKILVTGLAVRAGEESRAWTSEEIPAGLVRLLSWSEDEADAVGGFALELMTAEFANEPLPQDGRGRLALLLRRLRPGRAEAKS